MSRPASAHSPTKLMRSTSLSKRAADRPSSALPQSPTKRMPRPCTQGARADTMMDAAKNAVRKAQKIKADVAAARRAMLKADFPRVYHPVRNQSGVLTLEQFDKKFSQRSMELDFLRGDGAKFAWNHSEDVDIAEPHMTQRDGGKKGSYNARCNRYLTKDYARSVAPLTTCAMTGDIAGMHFAKEHYELDAADAKGDCALTLAALHGQHTALELLADFGAKLDVLDSKGWTAAHGAAAGRHSEVLKSLFKLGAPLDGLDRTGSTPMHYAARFNDTSCLKVLLILSFSSIGVKSKSGLMPLHLAAMANCNAAIEMIGGIGEVNIDDTDCGGETALHKAARANANAAYRALLTLGADRYKPNDSGETPLDLSRDSVLNALPHSECENVHYTGDARPSFTPTPGDTSRTNPTEQADKKRLQNELHRMRLEARRAAAFHSREAEMAMKCRAEVAQASKMEIEVKRASRLDIKIRRECHDVAVEEFNAKMVRRELLAAKRAKMEKARKVALKKKKRLAQKKLIAAEKHRPDASWPVQQPALLKR